MKALKSELSPLQTLVFAYAKARDRQMYEMVFAFDNRLAQVVRGTHEPLLGQMRMTWWRDVLTKPIAERPVGDPVLDALGGFGEDSIDLPSLVNVVDGWEALLIEESGEGLPDIFIQQRGGALFTTLAKACSGDIDGSIACLGEAWCLWDVGRHSEGAEQRHDTMQMLAGYRQALKQVRLSRRLRPLAILRSLILDDIKAGHFERPIMRPATAARIIWHGLSGW